MAVALAEFMKTCPLNADTLRSGLQTGFAGWGEMWCDGWDVRSFSRESETSARRRTLTPVAVSENRPLY